LSRQYGQGLRRPEAGPSFLSRRGRAGRLRCFANRDSSLTVLGLLRYATGDKQMSGQTDRPTRNKKSQRAANPRTYQPGRDVTGP
jgi:hypothetical protein